LSTSIPLATNKFASSELGLYGVLIDSAVVPLQQLTDFDRKELKKCERWKKEELSQFHQHFTTSLISADLLSPKLQNCYLLKKLLLDKSLANHFHMKKLLVKCW